MYVCMYVATIVILAPTQLGRSALVRAAEKGRSHTVEVLVQGGANPNIQDEVS